ncbi:MAG TPA: carboxypeptidase-like regulatory domain-containing protein [Candidatus Baltobacteraceae bacterium]|nr:carboxypeptidase-like regulatory domain-containing protein [Candidatus Baltobacteraceae bacterium]
MKHAIPNACLALMLSLLLGQITDKTTGQPLRGVHVQVAQGHAVLHALTGRDGRFRIGGLRPGTHSLRYWSDDVPPQTIAVRIRGAKAAIGITACSTTLDYSCAGPGGGG